MRVLLDTCVLSELRKPQADAGVRQAVDEIPDDDLFVSVISIGEIAKGIALLDDSRRKRDLQSCLQALERDYADRIVQVDRETAHIWGELTAAARKNGWLVSASDGLIAASARRHGLHVMTRIIADFEPTGAMLLNPWVVE
ncbi:VapC toxin family PIN domain ribonuclease [Candidatus Entotheonella serta]|nr:VapC toxin family PIN domain ribonuclease [Candidatus Entotheonella serta]